MTGLTSLTTSSIKKLNSYLTNWLHNNGFEDIIAVFDSDFSYDLLNDIIYYSIIVTENHDKIFFEICQKYYPEELVEADNFILSFFHELGHYMTQDNFTNQEWEEYTKYADSFKEIDNPTKEDYLKYYESPVELEATKWACNYIAENTELVKSFFEGFTEALTIMLKENNIEVD